jgi:hypothetical protein
MSTIREIAVLLREAGSHRKSWITAGVIVCVLLGTADNIRELAQKTVLHWLASSSGEKGSIIFGIPSWFWGITLFSVFLFLWMLHTALTFKRELTPALDVSFNPDAEGIVKTRTEIIDPRTGLKVRDDMATYVRVTLTSRSQKTVKGCAAFVTKLEKRSDPKGSFFEFPLRGALPLTQVPIDVFPTVPATVDFLKVGLFDNQLGWTVPAPFRLDGALDEIGTYRFKIAIVGNDLAKDVLVEIDWLGKWDTIVGRQVHGQ